MTRITYWPERMEILVDGHAGSAEKGEDLICAAISTLANTLQAVLTIQDEMHGGTVWNKEKPFFHAWVKSDTDLKAQAFVIMETIATGYAVLAEQSPEYVTFEVITEEEEEK